MGIYMTVACGDWKTSAKLDLDETVGLEQACEHDEALRLAYRTVFGDDVDGVTRQVGCKDLLDALESVLQAAKAGLKSFVYSVYVPPGSVMSGTCSGVGGLRRGELYFGILGGLDHCTLTTHRRNEQGNPELVSQVDAREMKSIETDNFGTVKIRRRAVATRTVRFLRQIRKDLESIAPSAEVAITIG